MDKKPNQNINFLNGIRLVLKDSKYLVIMFITTTVMYIFLSISMQVLILDPLYWNWEMIFGNSINLEGKIFWLTVPILFGLVLTLMTYKIMELKEILGKNEALATSGLFVSLFVPGCSACLPFVLAFIGISYSFFSSAIAPFIIPIQILVYSLLLVAIYFLSKNICVKCVVKKNYR